MQAQLDAYNLAMTTLGISGLILCYSFYRSKLVPRLLAVWGLFGYATILCGSVLEVLGFDLLSIHTIRAACGRCSSECGSSPGIRSICVRFRACPRRHERERQR
jgi:hypothetical protein